MHIKGRKTVDYGEEIGRVSEMDNERHRRTGRNENIEDHEDVRLNAAPPRPHNTSVSRGLEISSTFSPFPPPSLSLSDDADGFFSKSSSSSLACALPEDDIVT
jgi:hypothetical protein